MNTLYSRLNSEDKSVIKMEKSVDWFAENSWPARNNYMDTENESQSCSQDEDTSDWLAENSWPASSKYFDGKE